MLKITDINKKNRAEFISMCEGFYDSKAVLHKIPIEYIRNTADEAIDDSPYLRCLILEVNEVIVGYSILSFTYSNEAGGMVLFLEELLIKEEFQGRGIGKDFFAWLFKTYDEKIKRYRLEVSKENESVCNLYHKLGFEEVPYLQMVVEK